MIKVDIKGDHIKISGHAMFADYGKDIVCASASSIVITSINSILRISKEALRYKKEDEILEIDILKHSKEVDAIILTMTDLLKQLSKDYSNNIQVNEEV